MDKKHKKSHQKLTKKQLKKRISWTPLCILLVLFIVGIAVFSISKSIARSSFYKNYVIFIEKTKVVLYPDITEKDEKANLKAWIDYTKRFLNQYPKDLSKLNGYIPQIENKEQEGNLEEAKGMILETRDAILKIVKSKQYYSQSIMMEDLLSLILDIEKTIDQKNDVRLMEQYQDFNTKFTFVIPVLIKSDVVLIGNLMDKLYKQALYQNMKEAKSTYQEIKPAFTKAYRDYKEK